ncbi:MAG: hypothetical protein ABI220_00320 [Candidatus Saccharimonadales bacterium]
MPYNLSGEQIAKVAAALGQLEPGFLPYPIFEQVARLVTLPVVEFIPLRKVGDAVEVLLIQRPADDPFWPGLLHTPGTIIRATDLHRPESDNEQAFNRILHDELKDTEISQPHYVGSLFHKSKRGTEQAQLYWAEVTGEPLVGEFYPIDSLPSGLIDSQITFIRTAALNFRQ